MHWYVLSPTHITLLIHHWCTSLLLVSTDMKCIVISMAHHTIISTCRCIYWCIMISLIHHSIYWYDIHCDVNDTPHYLSVFELPCIFSVKWRQKMHYKEVYASTFWFINCRARSLANDRLAWVFNSQQNVYVCNAFHKCWPPPIYLCTCEILK